MTTLVLGGTGKTGRRVVARHSTARLRALDPKAVAAGGGWSR
ncbi:MAG TPA: hypothetical protein VIW24_11840 [Aldersonia sp.]